MVKKLKLTKKRRRPEDGDATAAIHGSLALEEKYPSPGDTKPVGSPF